MQSLHCVWKKYSSLHRAGSAYGMQQQHHFSLQTVLSLHGRNEQESGVVCCACRSTPEVSPPDIWSSGCAEITRVVILG